LLLDIFLFCVGFGLSMWWFSVTILPLFYGLPKSLYWIARGLLSWRILTRFLVPPVLWNLAFIGAAVALNSWFPAASARLAHSGGFSFGQLFGLGGSIFFLFKKEGSDSLKEDFLATAIHYFVSDNPVLIGEFGYRHKIRELVNSGK